MLAIKPQMRVGLPYSHAGQMTLEEIVGGAPYGATTIAGGKGERQPSKLELDGARHQGALIAKTAAKLAAWTVRFPPFGSHPNRPESTDTVL